MKFTQIYSRKILTARQKLVLYSVLTICVFAFMYTYFLIAYMQKAMLLSIADSSPHIRIFLKQGDSYANIAQYLKSSKQVSRFDTGILIENDFTVTTRKQATEIAKPGEIFFSGIKKIQFIGYSFANEDYRPPVLLENVYSKTNRDLTNRRPKDEPIRIMTDQRENEKKENWCIVSKNLTNIFPLGPSAFGDVFEILTLGGEKSKITFRTAGYLSDSPLIINSSSTKCVVYVKKNNLIKFFNNYEKHNIIDIVVTDRLAVDSIVQELKEKFPTVSVECWKTYNQTAIPFLFGIKRVAFIGTGAIIFLAVIGISILISMLILDKIKQLAIIYAMGCTAFQLRMIFLLLGLRVAIFSLVIGGFSAWGVASLSRTFWGDIMKNFCSMPHSAIVYSVPEICFFAVIIIAACLIASWLPTKYIVNSDPINNLRNE
ncbi:MAG: FtsX-like permease family protein [Lentisphaeria bacterium]|nr:FtsX-like permease family protein [Lentisphaeria bacterium]